ncbi:hypothetical protein C8J56DRAFT_898288 [Mycena floridula]|nr:hypothetical protein C8J56DRAFT_898288 [Mycena floridula]
MATRNKRANRNVRSNESTRIIPVPDLDLFNKIVDGLNKLQDEELSEAKQGNLNTISKLNGRLFRHDEERIWATYWPILLDHISRATKLLASSSLDVPFLYHCFFGLMSTELRACWKSLGSTSTVWDCITFFMKHYGPSDPFRPPGFDIPIHEIITSILSHIMLRAYSTVREQQVTSSAGYLDIAIQLWLRSIIDIDIALESPACTSCMMFSISKDCSEPNDGLSDRIADSIARIKGGSLALLVGILLPVKSRGLKGLQVALTILCACCYSSNTALQQDLLSKGAVVTITRALRKLAEPRAFNRELFCVGILFIEHFFRSLPESSQSPFDDSGVSADKPWMIQALEGRILCSVIEASHKIFCSCGALGAGDNNADSHGFASPMVSLLDRIAYFSRDERILRAIRKELRRIDSKGLNVAYAAKNGKPCLVWDAWVEFQSNVTPLVEVRKMFYMEPQEICSYSKVCNRPCPNSKIIVKSAKRCGGCYLMYYCSRMCQKKDWKSGHKNVCWKNPLRYQSKVGYFFHDERYFLIDEQSSFPFLEGYFIFNDCYFADFICYLIPSDYYYFLDHDCPYFFHDEC